MLLNEFPNKISKIILGLVAIQVRQVGNEIILPMLSFGWTPTSSLE